MDSNASWSGALLDVSWRTYFESWDAIPPSVSLLGTMRVGTNIGGYYKVSRNNV